MREIALHIIDIAENGIEAGANLIRISVDEDRAGNRLTVEIVDNGKGIPPEMLDRVTDPFITSRTTRRVGLGLSLLETAAKRCEGTFSVSSELGKGTRISVVFKYDHIDRSPLGDLAGSVPLLIMGRPKVDLVYEHAINGKSFVLDTRKVRRKQKQDGSLSDSAMIADIEKTIRTLIEKIDRNGK